MGNSKFQLERVRGAPASTADIMADIRRVAEKAGAKIVSQRIYSELGKFDPSTASRRFGTWNQAIAAAGLDVANEINISDERLFENLTLLWEHFGRQPRRAELAFPPSIVSWGAYRRRFRSWTDALKQFVAYANAQEVEPSRPKNAETVRRTGRDPSLRVRFRVMKRDNFSCCACGASPALTRGILLHIDHIEPWSRGGETVEENLQTLCESCNLGKSNVI